MEDSRGKPNLEKSLSRTVTGVKGSATVGFRLPAQGISLVVQVSGGTLAHPNSAAPPRNDKADCRGKQGRYNFESRALVLLFIF